MRYTKESKKNQNDKHLSSLPTWSVLCLNEIELGMKNLYAFRTQSLFSIAHFYCLFCLPESPEFH